MDLIDMKNVRLVSFEVFSEPAEFPLFLPDDKKPREFYAKIIYQAENKEGKWEIVFPKVEIPIFKHYLPQISYGPSETIGNFGFGDLRLQSNDAGHSIIATRVAPAVHDMTLSEIEKCLGYKVRIVGENGNG